MRAQRRRSRFHTHTFLHTFLLTRLGRISNIIILGVHAGTSRILTFARKKRHPETISIDASILNILKKLVSASWSSFIPQAEIETRQSRVSSHGSEQGPGRESSRVHKFHQVYIIHSQDPRLLQVPRDDLPLELRSLLCPRITLHPCPFPFPLPSRG